MPRRRDDDDGLVTPGGWRPAAARPSPSGPRWRPAWASRRARVRDLRAAGRAAAEAAVDGLDLRPGHVGPAALPRPDVGRRGRGAIDGAYAVAGGRVPLAGGGANGRAPALYRRRRRVPRRGGRRRARLARRRSPSPSRTAAARASEPAIATRTEGRTVRELNGRPAEDVYLEGIGHAGADARRRRRSRRSPCCTRSPSPSCAARCACATSRAAPTGGGLACATRIPPNAAVWFTEQTTGDDRGSAGEAVHEALALLPAARRGRRSSSTAPPASARWAPRLAEEAATLRRGVRRRRRPCTGLYTRGEVGRTRGAKGDRNHAVVVVALA